MVPVLEWPGFLFCRIFLKWDVDVKGLVERIVEKESDGGVGYRKLILTGENLLD